MTMRAIGRRRGAASLALLLLLLGAAAALYYRSWRRDEAAQPTKIRRGPARHVWTTLARAPSNAALARKFEAMLASALDAAPIDAHALHVNIITDEAGRAIADGILDRLESMHPQAFDERRRTFYDLNACAELVRDIIACMQPHFSSRPGSYYSDALFFLSLGLHRIAPLDQHRVVMLDCDLKFVSSLEVLFSEFDSFPSAAFFGLGHELSSVYRHVLYNYRNKNANTPFGSEVDFYRKIKAKKKDVSSVANLQEENLRKGFPGYNSGVILIDLDKIRESKMYDDMLSCDYIGNLTEKYMFKGHLGDQDFFTLLGYESPELFHTLDCGWNRQLCKWWRQYEDIAVFDEYYKCDRKAKVYHGNCNTPIPS